MHITSLPGFVTFQLPTSGLAGVGAGVVGFGFGLGAVVVVLVVVEDGVVGDFVEVVGAGVVGGLVGVGVVGGLVGVGVVGGLVEAGVDGLVGTGFVVGGAGVDEVVVGGCVSTGPMGTTSGEPSWAATKKKLDSEKFFNMSFTLRLELSSKLICFYLFTELGIQTGVEPRNSIHYEEHEEKTQKIGPNIIWNAL